MKQKEEVKIVIVPFSDVGWSPEEIKVRYLDKVSEDGWCLVNTFRQMGGVGWVFIFKREV